MIPPFIRRLYEDACKPRASGDDPLIICIPGPRPPVNPARAGMIPDEHCPVPRSSGKPRASGDDPGERPDGELGAT